MKKLISILLVCLMVMPFSIFATVFASAQEDGSGAVVGNTKTVYLSDTGADTNDGLSATTPVKTITRAYQLLGKDGGTLSIVGKFTPTANIVAPAHTGTVTITGNSDDSALYMSTGRRFYLGGPTVFDNITIDVTKSGVSFYVVCLYNDFTATENLVTAGSGQVLLAVATQKDANDFGNAKDVEITLNGGRWTEVIGGMRQAFTVAKSVKKTADNFKDHNVTFNIGGDVTVGKLFAAHRSAGGNMVAPNSSCNINLLGGVVTHFICQNDQKAYNQGYENGMTVYIAKTFDITKSFDGAGVDAETRLDSNSVFNGINPWSAYDDSKITATASIDCNTLVVDDEVYDTVIADTKVRLGDFEFVKKYSDTLKAIDVYISDNGDDENDGLSAETPIKSIARAYHMLGDVGGSIIIVDKFTPTANIVEPEHTGVVTYKGYTEESSMYMSAGRRLYLGGPVVFDNITLDVTKSTFYVVCLYNNFTATENFTVNGTSTVLLAVATEKGANDFGNARDVEITLNGGRWTEVIGGMRNGYTVSGGTKTAANFKDHEVVFNIGGTAVIGKLFAAHRSAAGNIVSPNSSCTVNLTGGVITHFLCQNDQKSYVQGYENGFTVNIADTFDISQSFDGVANIDPETRLQQGDANMVFYGLSPKTAFDNSKFTSTEKIPTTTKLVIDEDIFAEVIATNKVRTADFDEIVYPEGYEPEAPEEPVIPDDPIVYITDSGNDNNHGKTAEAPIKSLARAYEILGDEGGMIVVVGTFTQSANFTEPEHSGKIRIVGADDTAEYVIGAGTRFILAGETEFADLHIKAKGSASWYVICNFNNFKVAETVTMTRTGTFIVNLGAQSGTAYTAKDATLILESGDWSEVVGAARQNLNTIAGKTEADLDGVDLVITIDKNATVGKLFAFSRSVNETYSIVPDGTLRVNLLGGKITCFVAQTDKIGYTQGMDSGMVIYIGKDFDITESFLDGNQNDDGYVSDSTRSIFYGISGESAYNYNDVTAVIMNRSGVIIAAEIYDQIKDHPKLRASTFAYVIMEGDAIPELGTPDRAELDNVYVSDSGHEYNNGINSSSNIKGSAAAFDTVSNNGTMIVGGTFTIDTSTNKTGLAIKVAAGATLYLNVDPIMFASFVGNGTIIVSDEVKANLNVEDFIGFEGNVLDKDGNNAFGDSMYIKGQTGDCQYAYNILTNTLTISGNGIPAKLELARTAAHIIFEEGVTTIPVAFCYNNKNLKSVTLSSTVTIIEESAFNSTDNLTTFIIPENSALTTVGAKAFLFSGVTALDFNDNLKYVGDYAFRDCHKLKSVDLGNCIEYLGSYAFARTIALESLTFDGTLTAIADCTFLQSSKITSITIPDSVTSIGTKAFMNATSLTSVVFPAGLLEIGLDAFKDTGLVGTVELPASVTTIGERAFYNCTALTGIILPEQLTSLGKYSFALSAITSIVLPEGVVEIGDKTFYCCDALSTVTVLGDLTALGNYVFAESGLTSFVIPETCTTVGNGIFYKCHALESVSINVPLEAITTKMFYDCSALTSVNIPETVVNIHPYAFYNCSSLTEIEIPAGLKLLYNYAFANTSSLSVAITIPGTVAVVGEKCFMGSGITSVVFDEGVEAINASAFENSALTSAYIPATVEFIGEKAFAASNSVAIHTEKAADAVIAWAADNSAYVNCTTDYVPADGTIAVVYTEEELVAALTLGKIIKVAADIELTDKIVIPAGASVTIDLYGHSISQVKECTASYEMISNNGALTIFDSVGGGKISFTDTGAGDPSASWGSYTIRTSGTLTVNGGTIENLSAQNVKGAGFAHTSLAIFQYSGTTTINGGKISTPAYRSVRLWNGDLIIKGGEFEGQVWVQCVNDNARLILRGGSFAPAGNDGSSVFINNVKTDGSLYFVRLYVYGGTFATRLGSNAVIKNAVIADGYDITENANGSWNIVNSASDESTYSVCSEYGFNHALASGKTIKLTADIELTRGIIVPADKTVKIDLNGKVLSHTVECVDSYEMILNYGDLTIMDSVGGGKISFTDTGAGSADAKWGSYTIRNIGNLTVNGGTIENLSAQNVTGAGFAHTSLAIFQYSGRTVVNGGTISTPNYRSIRLWSGELTINGGTFDGQVWVQCVNDSAKLTINGGDFSPNWNDGSSAYINNVKTDGSLYYVELTIAGGNFATRFGANAVIENAVIADGFEQTVNANGSWVIVNAN